MINHQAEPAAKPAQEDKDMTKQQVMDYFNFSDRLAKTVLNARLDYIGNKTYTLTHGDKVYKITKRNGAYQIKEA